MKTKIEMLRKGGRGIEGTYANADHHAKPMLPFIETMAPFATKMGFALWRAGHNIHEFITSDGRRFTLRGIIRDKDEEGNARYVGVRLSMRLSRSEEERLFDIDSVQDVPLMIAMMTNLAKPQIGRDSRLMNGCGSN